MATDVPQRELRNRTADLLRRVEAGERLRITVHGHPIAELVPIEDEYPARTFVSFQKIVDGLSGLLQADDPWAEEIRRIRDEQGPGRDPFEGYEEQRTGRPAPEET